MTVHTPQAAALTDLILEIFRLNGRLLAAGDQLTKDDGLSSARWQVLGAIDSEALPVAQIARNMGLTRQAVQRLANVLASDGLVAFSENPNHRRAKLVGLTPRGRTVLDNTMSKQVDWSNQLSSGMSASQIASALSALRTLRQRLER
jgi:DNA-binding MarR family transcriptional regulator